MTEHGRGGGDATRDRYNVLGIRIAAVDYDSAVETIIGAARARHALSVSALAVHGVMTGVLDPIHRFRLNHLDLLVPDGQPVRWALRWLHRVRLGDRVYGPRLMLKLCERAAADGIPIFLFGGPDSLLAALQARLTHRIPRLAIAGVMASRFRQLTAEEQQALTEAIRTSGAGIAFIGLGCPRQEVCVFELQPFLSLPLVAVGAAFSFHAGLLPQAPPVLQAAGLEWLYRLVQEPRRLWRRYVFLNPLYLVLVLLQRLGLGRFDPDRTLAPTESLRYG